MKKSSRQRRGSPHLGEVPWISEDDLRRERRKAREIRQSPWWKRRISRGICHYCGSTFPPAELTLDHVVPLVRGGKSTRGNCVPCCKDCNTKKQSLLPVEWESYLKSLGQ